MIKILTVIGARPQIIKAAALSRAIKKKFANTILEVILHTGQHYDENMSKVFFDELQIPMPNYNLNVGSGSHGVQTAKMIELLEKVLIDENPNYIVLYGDTNSTLAGAIAAPKLNIPIVHIEAGLRSFNRSMPEEINRITCDHLSTLLFSPTRTGYDNLIKEGFSKKINLPSTPDNPSIFHCGDVMYDNSLFFAKKSASEVSIIEDNNLSAGKYILTTIHRPYNTDNESNLKMLIQAMTTLAADSKIVFPIHPRTKKILETAKYASLYKALTDTGNFVMIPPASFLEMIELERNAQLVMTDSGGVQKEAYFFNKPCIILRPETEWVEILETEKAILTSAVYNKIIAAYEKLKEVGNEEFPVIFGDGKAAEFILQTIVNNES